MLVRVAGHESDLSGAEARFVALLRKCVDDYHLPGLALINVSIPEKKTGSRQVDAVVFCRAGLLVVEVKGLTSATSGCLQPVLNGPWTIDGAPADMYSLRSVNALGQARNAVMAAKSACTTAGVDAGYVQGLVSVFVPSSASVTLGKVAGRVPGVTVKLGELTSLRRLLHRLNDVGRTKKIWSADDVLAAAAAMDARGLVPDRSELVSEGFTDLATPHPGPVIPRQKPLRTPQSPPPQPSTPEASISAAVSGQGQQAAAVSNAPRPPVGVPRPSWSTATTTPLPRSRPRQPMPARPAAQRKASPKTVVAVFAVLAMVAFAVWIAVTVAQVFHPA